MSQQLLGLETPIMMEMVALPMAQFHIGGEAVGALDDVTWPCKFSPSEGIISLLKGLNNGDQAQNRRRDC